VAGAPPQSWAADGWWALSEGAGRRRRGGGGGGGGVSQWPKLPGDEGEGVAEQGRRHQAGSHDPSAVRRVTC
jgi:hypothetical protein